ncbi:MAG: ribosome biogenesis GTP-binding protein YihA/YsxC [Flammeovirgaceae bacterium]
MEIREAAFVISNTDYRKCPKPTLPEYAFIGRSNVGKSSLINTLTGRKSLAKISGKPGKTRLINHFKINNNWFLVDLPGYGYAQIGKEEREKFKEIIEGYLLHRENLICTFVLIDIRHDPQKIDLEFMQWMGENGLPFVIVFTKSDKVKEEKIAGKISRYREKLLEAWEEMPQFFITSSLKKNGQEDVLDFIDGINKNQA